MIEVLVPNNKLETVSALATIVSATTERDFLAQRKDPVVLIPQIRDSGSGSLDESAEVSPFDPTPGPGFYTLAGAKSPVTRILESFRDAVVAPLQKSDRNTFAHMITVGRASNNDIVVAVSTISKLHGYFMRQPDGNMRFYDAGSTNGTWVSGQKVAPRTAVALEDGAEIALGPDVKLLYRTPSGLFETLRLVSSKR
jgi:hypothetical protein